LITNPTGVTSRLRPTIDALHSHTAVHLTVLYGPEHGVRGEKAAGERVAFFVDEKTGLPVYSLYGATKKPTPKMLNNVDVLLFDIQDVGVRPYTYIYTMAYAMQAATEKNIPFIVLDRPNPLGGTLIEGPMLEDKYRSFIGLYPIPYIYGMTIGELAALFNEEFEMNTNLTVVPMSGWRRDMIYKDTGLSWVPTSPHVPHAWTPFFLAATGGFGELQTINEGVGYTTPFEYVGAEWINADTLAKVMNALELAGVFFRPIHYRPYYGVKKDLICHGVQIHIIDYHTFYPIKTQIAILKSIYDLYPGKNIFNPDRIDMFYKAIGTDKISRMIKNHENLNDIYEECHNGIEAFVKKRKNYLLYN